jgi:hypothetical protein
LALTRVDCFEAFTTYTSPAGIPLARAMLRIGRVIRGSLSLVYWLNSGKMNTGAMRAPSMANRMVTPLPQIHQVRGARRSTP